MDLPDMYMEEKQVVRIGEDLGKLLNWSLEEPYPMIQVMLECDAPLVMFRETVLEEGELFRIRFEYVKLQNHCTWCCRMTHETRNCPTRLGPMRNHQEGQRDPIRRRKGDGDRRGRRGPRVEPSPSRRNREQAGIPLETFRVQASLAKRKPVRRDLTEELSDTLLEAEEQRAAKESTKEWIRKAFAKEEERVGIAIAGVPVKEDLTEQDYRLGIHNNSWYRNTEEEAKVAKLVYAQNEAWEKVEGSLRQSKMVDKYPVEAMEWRPKAQTVAGGGARRAGSRGGGKERTVAEEDGARNCLDTQRLNPILGVAEEGRRR